MITGFRLRGRRAILEDSKIVELFWKRSESAIMETAKKYGSMLQRLSESVLHSAQDAEECVNDSYISAWNSMPENRPCYLGAYMAKITRNHSLNLLEKKNALKRQGEDLIYDELADVLEDPESPANWEDSKALTDAINGYLATLTADKRAIFVRRYFFNDSEDKIAKDFGLKSGNVRIILHRLRLGLKLILEKEELL